MKKILYIVVALLITCNGLSSCKEANELPPLDRGYARDVVVPEPEDLTRADRVYLEELEEEYNNSLNQ